MSNFRKATWMLCAAAALLSGIGLMAACEKDDTKPSAHKFTEKQQEVLNILHGRWQGDIEPSEYLEFTKQFDTNVVVYKHTEEFGQVEDYQYQGTVIHNGITYNYYVTETAEYLYLYEPERGVLVIAPVLEVLDDTHFRLLYNLYSNVWVTYQKV